MTVCHANNTQSPGHFRTIKDAELYCENRWPEWYRNRYRAVGTELSEQQPSPSESSLLLWKLAQLQRKMPNKPLYLETLVKGSVGLLGIVVQRNVRSSGSVRTMNDDAQKDLPHSLTARTMLSLACLGLGLVWQEEMEVLCDRLTVMRLETMQQVEDVSRALRVAKHWTEHFSALEECAVLKLRMRGNDTKQDGTRNNDDVNKATYCANNLSYMGYMPYALCGELEKHVSKMSQPALLSYAKALSRCLAAASEHAQKDNDLFSKTQSSCISLFDYLCVQDHAWLVDRHHQYYRNAGQLFPFLLTIDVCIPFEEHRRTRQQRERFNALLESTRVLWLESSAPNKHQISSFQREVHSLVERLVGASSIPWMAGCPVKMETVVMESISVDIALEDVRIAIEVDGYSHFCRNDTQKSIGNGPWKKTMLSKMGWTMVSVSQPRWDSLGLEAGTTDAKMAHVSQLLLSEI